MSYQYPIDVDDFVRLAKQRGDPFVKAAGLKDDLREDEKLNCILWNASLGWFPVTQTGDWHGALDVGLPDASGQGGIFGKPVTAIADGVVVFVEGVLQCSQGYDFGRVIVEHQTPDGETFYAQYRHLEPVFVFLRQPVRAGDELGQVGWHGDFPHVELSMASQLAIGGADDLVPEAAREALPQSSGVWNLQRVRVERLDPSDWPIFELAGQAGYLFHPIELIRHCLRKPYKHVVGPGTIHEVEPVPEGPQKALAPGEDLEVEVGTVLRSTALASSEALVKLAHDPGFTPIGKGHADKGVVEAVQRALKACAFEMGRFGPEGDGIDGDYGGTTERVVKQFQTGKLKEMMDAAGDAGILGKKRGDLKSDGKVDWLTLMGLDTCAALHAPLPPQEPVPSSDPPPERSPPPPKEPAPLVNTFDASKGEEGLSLHFGVRMYLALLGWLWEGKWDVTKAADKAYHGDAKDAGVGYSTCNPFHPGPEKTPRKKNKDGSEVPLKDKKGNELPSLENEYAVIDDRLKNEWPDLQADWAKAKVSGGKDKGTIKTVTVGEQTYPLFAAWGTTWVGSQYTNCCNSQLAALTKALEGGKFTVEGGQEFFVDRKKPSHYDITRDAPSDLVTLGTFDKDNKYQEKKPGVLAVFEATFVTGPLYWCKEAKKPTIGGDLELDGDGNPIFQKYFPKRMTVGGMIYAVEALGIGRRLFDFKRMDIRTSRQVEAKALRISDLATWSGHAWMIGDVRYGVWLENIKSGANAAYIIDQSSFIGDGAEKGTFVRYDPSIGYADMDGRAPKKAQPARPQEVPPTEKDCRWLLDAQNEKEFLKRVRTFLETAPDAEATPARPTAGKVRIDGRDFTVKQIQVMTWRVFSANGTVNTAHSIEQKGTAVPGTGCRKGKYEPDLVEAIEGFARKGITRPWCASKMLPEPVSAARLYGPPSHTGTK